MCNYWQHFIALVVSKIKRNQVTVQYSLMGEPKNTWQFSKKHDKVNNKISKFDQITKKLTKVCHYIIYCTYNNPSNPTSTHVSNGLTTIIAITLRVIRFYIAAISFQVQVINLLGDGVRFGSKNVTLTV